MFHTGIIIWHDAVNFGGVSSQYSADELPHKPLLMYTVGLITASSPAGVTFAREISEDGQCRGVGFIPRGMILKEIITEKDVVEITPGKLRFKCSAKTKKRK